MYVAGWSTDRAPDAAEEPIRCAPDVTEAPSASQGPHPHRRTHLLAPLCLVSSTALRIYSKGGVGDSKSAYSQNSGLPAYVKLDSKRKRTETYYVILERIK